MVFRNFGAWLARLYVYGCSILQWPLYISIAGNKYNLYCPHDLNADVCNWRW